MDCAYLGDTGWVNTLPSVAAEADLIVLYAYAGRVPTWKWRASVCTETRNMAVRATVLGATLVAGIASCGIAMANPKSWEGIWAHEKSDCQTEDQLGNTDQTAIKLTRTEMLGLENRCAIETIGAKAGEVVLDLNCSGEGMEYQDRWYVQLKRNELYIHDEGEEPRRYFYCGPASP